MIDYKRINETKIEDYIYIVYYLIITLAIYANVVERRYLKYNDMVAKKEYRTILFIIYIIAFFVYLYYTYDGIQTLKEKQDNETRRLNELSLIASLLVLVSGIIYLYLVYKDVDVNLELAFS